MDDWLNFILLIQLARFCLWVLSFHLWHWSLIISHTCNYPFKIYIYIISTCQTHHCQLLVIISKINVISTIPKPLPTTHTLSTSSQSKSSSEVILHCFFYFNSQIQSITKCYWYCFLNLSPICMCLLILLSLFIFYIYYTILHIY